MPKIRITFDTGENKTNSFYNTSFPEPRFRGRIVCKERLHKLVDTYLNKKQRVAFYAADFFSITISDKPLERKMGHVVELLIEHTKVESFDEANFIWFPELHTSWPSLNDILYEVFDIPNLKSLYFALQYWKGKKTSV